MIAGLSFVIAGLSLAIAGLSLVIAGGVGAVAEAMLGANAPPSTATPRTPFDEGLADFAARRRIVLDVEDARPAQGCSKQ